MNIVILGIPTLASGEGSRLKGGSFWEWGYRVHSFEFCDIQYSRIINGFRNNRDSLKLMIEVYEYIFNELFLNSGKV